MQNHELIPAVTRPQTTEEFFEAAKVEFARGLARLAKTDNANPRTLELLERALFNREVVALKTRELDLVRQRLDRDRDEFDSHNAIRHRRRLVAIEVQAPVTMENAQPTMPDTHELAQSSVPGTESVRHVPNTSFHANTR